MEQTLKGGQRELTATDRLMVNFDQALRTVFGRPLVTGRPDPDAGLSEPMLDEAQSHDVAGLMRVNHAGEVSAQALYQGQALTARDPEVRRRLEQAAREENDHLAWCERRLAELGGHTSYLNPLWYAGSFAIGALAGVAGDRWSLGFLAETERQVVRHLDAHLERLPREDARSRAILEQMREDEGHHATTAVESGAAELPGPVRSLMGLVSRVMTTVAYRL
jgi:ubiquinone biosynthesis monooxygenase Coq7